MVGAPTNESKSFYHTANHWLPLRQMNRSSILGVKLNMDSSCNIVDIINSEKFGYSLLHVQVAPKIQLRQLMKTAPCLAFLLLLTGMIAGSGYSGSTSQDSDGGSAKEEKMASTSGPGHDVGLAESIATTVKDPSELNRVLAKPYILKHIASKNIGMEIPFSEQTIQSSENYDVDQDVGSSGNVKLDIPTKHVQKSGPLLSERLVGINTTAHTISILDTSEYEVIYDEQTCLSEIGQNFGIDECLESLGENIAL
ncbi:hypothetical protein I9W82_002162 [Candida metapsilosis]|uniref:Uncharacterized protein n=1 Tax=Candida metapsilosis TaxID=273372 RepID=A0A8H7ZE46_9ASCO|nr:hypothetical protein I9W82_002162 [Candida metapsilosis]